MAHTLLLAIIAINTMLIVIFGSFLGNHSLACLRYLTVNIAATFFYARDHILWNLMSAATIWHLEDVFAALLDSLAVLRQHYVLLLLRHVNISCHMSFTRSRFEWILGRS